MVYPDRSEGYRPIGVMGILLIGVMGIGGWGGEVAPAHPNREIAFAFVSFRSCVRAGGRAGGRAGVLFSRSFIFLLLTS